MKNSENKCELSDVMTGYDTYSWLQQRIYVAMSGLYSVTALFIIFYFIVYVIIKNRFYKKIYLIILYGAMCILYFTKALFYLGGDDVIKYEDYMYRLLTFIPALTQGTCFLIYSLALQEILILEQEAEQGPNRKKFIRVRLATFISLIVYVLCYIGAYIFNAISNDEHGKDVYFGFRTVISIPIAIPTIWSIIKVKETLKKYDNDKKAGERVIIMAWCLIVHCILKTAISVLFYTNILMGMKAEACKDPNYWYYVGYLSLHHFFNEYVPCTIIIYFLTVQEEGKEGKNELKVGTNEPTRGSKKGDGELKAAKLKESLIRDPSPYD